MFLIKFFYFLKGYVIIEAYGNSVCKLISKCAEDGIKLYNIKGGESSVFVIHMNDFYDLYILAVQMNVKLKVKKEVSFSNMVLRYKKRIGFPVGMALFVLFFFISSLFLWDIRVETDGNIDKNEVLHALSQIGVKRGAFIKDLPDGMEMKRHLVNSFENVPWAWVYINGIRATVQIHEGTVPPVVVDDNEPCDIVASKDGFVISVSAKEGKDVVSSGNGVNAGDTLISGLIETETADGLNSYTVHADGEVMALTRYEKHKEYPLWEYRPEFTGREKRVYCIKLFSKEICLFSPPKYSYSIKTENEIFTNKSFGITQIKYVEAKKHKVQLPAEWVVEFAKRDLSAQIASELGKNARLQREDYIINEKSNSVEVTATMEFVEDIGVTVPR